MGPSRQTIAAHVGHVLASTAAVGLATGAVYAARDFVPVLSLGVVYLPAVLVGAVAFGLPYAIGVSLASVLAFNFPLPAAGSQLRHFATPRTGLPSAPTS